MNVGPNAPPASIGLEKFDLTLLANFVHQVVNPLNGVAGTLDNLADGVIREPNRREQRLRAARAQLEQCITLMRNLAFLAQGTGGVAEQDNRKVVIPQAAIESAMFYQEDGENKHITISVNDRWAGDTVFGHQELLRQVFMNIFDNCIKYGIPYSEIVVNHHIQTRTSMAVITIDGKSQYPISPNDLKHLGDLGFRGENARKIVASGTGLGMYICKQIVEKTHGGTLHVQTVGADGIQFTIKLPRGEPAGNVQHHG